MIDGADSKSEGVPQNETREGIQSRMSSETKPVGWGGSLHFGIMEANICNFW